MKTWNKRILYEKLKENPQLVFNNTLLEVFKDSIEQTVLDDIYTVAKLRLLATEATAAEKQAIVQNARKLNHIRHISVHKKVT